MSNHTVPYYRLHELTFRVAKLNKSAAKLGMPAIELKVGKPYAKTPYNDSRIESPDEGVRWLVDVELIGSAPVVAGFTFIARLEHTPAGNLISKGFAAHDLDLETWQHAGARCQHCGLDRARRDTFLLRDPDGRLAQIGSTCLADYTRSEDAAAAARVMALWAELGGCLDVDDESFGGCSIGDPSTIVYLSAAVGSVRRYGYKKTNEEGCTRDHASFLTSPPPPRHSPARRGWEEDQPSKADCERAAAIMVWINASTDRSDYMHNLRVAFSQPVATDRTRGLIASAPAAFDRHEGKQRERQREARPAPAGHFGEVGKRFDTVVTIDVRRGYETDYGEGTMLIMRDGAGHVFKTFSSGGDINRREDWAGTFTLRATVKSHETDREGRPVTLLSRCVLTPVETQAEVQEAS